MDLQSPPAYSLLETIDLKKTITNWNSLYEYCRKFPAPTEGYEKYTVALVSSKEPELKRKLSSVLAEVGIANAIMRNGETTVIILRTKNEKSAIDAFGIVSLKCGVHMQIVDEGKRSEHVLSGAWPMAIPYAASILPTPAKWYDKGRPSSSGCLHEDSPNVTRLSLAAASPKFRRAASVATGAFSTVLGAATFEKVGGTIGVFMGGAPGGAAIGVFMGGAPGGAAGTLAGKSLDGLHTTNGDENVPQEQITDARMMLRLRKAELVSTAMRKGMSVEDAEKWVKLGFSEVE